MADSDFLLFQTYASAEEAQPLLAALAGQGIETKTVVDKGQLAFDPSFANNRSAITFIVKLRAADFELARQLQQEVDQVDMSEVPFDYYLLTFADEELFDLLAKPDEWSSFDVALARQLLRQRGYDVTLAALGQLRQRRAAALAQPEPSHPFWVVLGYLFALAGGVFGMLIGYHLHFHRKTLPDGRRVYAFNSRDRGNGLIILIVAVLVLLAGMATRLLWVPHVQY